MPALFAIALLVVLLWPSAAEAQDIALAIGPEVSAAERQQIHQRLGDFLLVDQRWLIGEGEVREVLGGELDHDPSLSELETWAGELGADLIVSIFIDEATGAENPTLRMAVHRRAQRITAASSRVTPRATLPDVALAMLRSLIERDGPIDDSEVQAEEPREEPLGAAPTGADDAESDDDEEISSLAPPPPLPQDDEPEHRNDGRVHLILNSTLLGFSLMTGVLFAADVQDPRLFAPIFLIGGAGGLATAFMIYNRWRVSRGDNSVVAVGGWYGAGLGVLMAGILGYDDIRWLITGGLIGQVLGLGAGIAAAAFTEISAGDGAVIHSGSIWGTFIGGVMATLVSDNDPRTSYGLILVGLVTGVGLGALTSHFIEMSSGRAAVIDVCGLLGVLLGASVGTPVIVEDQSAGHLRAYAGILLGTAALGIGIGTLITRNWDRGSRPSGDRSRANGGRHRVRVAPLPALIPPAPSAPRSSMGFGVQLVGGMW